MAGKEGLWKNCDHIYVSITDAGSYEEDNQPQVLLNVENIVTFDSWEMLAISPSQCIFIISQVRTVSALQDLINFGQAVAKYKRLGMVLTLGPGRHTLYEVYLVFGQKRAKL